MQRKATKNTRAANTEEKKFHAWLKCQPCCVCGNEYSSTVHHCMGATYKHNKTLIGHWFCIPLCHTCDEVITYGSRREFKKRFGLQSALWLEVAVDYCVEVPLMSGRTKTALSDQFSTIPEEIFKSIEDCGE